MSNYSFKVRLPQQTFVWVWWNCSLVLLYQHHPYFSPYLSVSFSSDSPWAFQLFFSLPHLLCFMATIKGTLTLKHDRATPTPTTTIIWKKNRKKITPALFYTPCNLGVTFVFYHIFLGSQNSVAVSPCAARQLQPTRSPENYKVGLTPCILCNRGLWRLWLWALCLINSLRKAKFESEAST